MLGPISTRFPGVAPEAEEDIEDEPTEVSAERMAEVMADPELAKFFRAPVEKRERFRLG